MTSLANSFSIHPCSNMFLDLLFKIFAAHFSERNAKSDEIIFV